MAQRNARTDDNWKPTLIAVSTADGLTPVALEADPITGNLQVDASVSISAADGAITDGVDSNIKATVKDLTNSNPLATQIMDANGDAITSFGGGTQYTEDAAAAANPVGTAMNLVRDDARGGSLTTADGDNVAARGTNAGELYVKHVDAIPVTDNGGSLTVDASSLPLPTGAATAANQSTGNTSLATVAGAVKLEDDVAASGDPGITALTVRRDTAATSAGTDGDYATLNTDNTGRLWVRIGNTDSLTPGTAAANLGKAEDAGHSSGDTGVMLLGVRVDDGGVGQTSANGDYSALAVDARAAQRVVGNVDNDATDLGSPLKVGGQARTTNPTAVADGDRANFITDDVGRQIITGSIRDLKVAQVTTITASTSETTVVTAGASGVFHDVYAVIVTNTSSTATEVAFKDSTGGTTRFTISAPANDTRGFMLPESAGHNQATAANNWTATAADSVSSLLITVMAVKNV